MLFGFGLERREQTYYFEQIEELSVDITDDDDGFLDENDIGFAFFLLEDVLRMAMKRSTRYLTHVLGSFFSYERSCLMRVMLIFSSRPSWSYREVIYNYKPKLPITSSYPCFKADNMP